MRNSLRSMLVACLLAASGLALEHPLAAQVSLTTIGSPYTQSFDTLLASGSTTWTNNSTIPGWFHARTGTGTTIVANNGSSNAGNLYSYGTGTATDRALGSVGSGNAAVGNLFWGVRLQNNTGATITSLDVSYTGEQWRNSAAAAQTVAFSYLVGSPTVTGSLAEFQSAGVAVAALDFTSPITGGVAGALDGNLAANRVTLTFSIGSLSIPNGTEVMLRWSDPDHTGADHGLSIDDFSVTPQGGPPTPTLNVGDATVTEGDAGTVIAAFNVTLTAPAGAGGVTFDIATADGTAQDDNPVGEDEDYVAQSLTGQTITSGNNSYTFNVTVNGDTEVEPNENFFVNVTNITGANAGDTQGQGTINNDDVTVTPIHDVQGPGASSPIPGASVTMRGIVTGVKSNGFFVQEEEADYDADPATSEGILVFTSGAPPAAAAVGNLVQVTGTVSEFVPSQDPLQPPLTELTSPTTVLVSSGNPLPAAIPLTATFPDPAGVHDQLERHEGMRVSAASLTVFGPTLGNVNEPNATATSTGVFYGVVTGNARPFREPGIQAPDPPPAGTIPPIPRFDSNPERLRVDSDGQTGGGLIDVATGAVVTGLIGPLDYSFRTYTILPDPATPPGVAGGPTPTAVAVPTASEFTVGAYNLERFFDTVNDPGIGEPVLTAVAFDNRLNKVSLGIRNFLRFPDVIGIVECENLTTLQAIAARVSADAIAASQPDPQYQAFLVEGNDIGGIDVGFLTKGAIVFGATPRVQVVAVTQENAGEMFVNPDTSSELLNDRPSLVLEAIVHHPNGAAFPVVVIVNHLRSLNGVSDLSPGSNGWATGGDRVRAKRQKQAESLANLVQARQVADPAERLILVGDFNAFELNDGFGDSMNVIGGTPSPDNQTAVPGDGIDLVNPDLVNLASTAPAADRYSFVFDGNAQSLDHVVINADTISDTSARREEHPRINADFPETARNNTTDAVRLADHDPVVAFFSVAGFLTADLAITKTDGVATAVPGGSVTYSITASNAGPDPVTGATVADTFPAILNCTWTCAGAGGGTCTAAGSGNINDSVNLPVGGFVTYTASCTINASATGTLSNTATVSSTVADPDPANNSATDTDTLTPQADLAVTKTDGVATAVPGGSVTYTITASNPGPSNAPGSTVADTFPASLTCTWTCAGAGGGTCTAAGSGNISDTVNLPSGGSVTYTASCNINPAVSGSLSNTATVAAGAGVTDPTPGNNSASDTDTLTPQADLGITKTDGVTSATPGGSTTYTLVASNPGPSNAPSSSVSDTAPAACTGFNWTCAGAGGGTCTAAGSGSIGDNVNLPSGGSVTYTVVCNISGAATGTLVNTATVSTTPILPPSPGLGGGGVTDPNPGNNSATDTDTLGQEADLSITKTDGLTNATAGQAITYTIVAANAGPSGVTGATVADTFPAALTGVTWTCVGAGGGTCTAAGAGNINDLVNLPDSATVTYTVNATISAAFTGTLSNTATVAAPGGVSDPNPANNSATDTTTVAGQAAVTGTKEVSGDFSPGGAIIYTVTLTNNGGSAQGDNPGDELTDVLPPQVTLVSASATSGTAVATVGTNTVTWNGSIPAGGSVTITIDATIDPDASGDISNQGTIAFDADNNGTNESTGQTDDPAAGGPADPTVFGIALGTIAIPTLDGLGLMLLVLALAGAAFALLRRRRAA